MLGQTATTTDPHGSQECTLANGRQSKGHDLIEGTAWRWQQHPWGARGAVRAAARHESDPWPSHGDDRRYARPRPFLPGVFGDRAERSTADPQVAPAPRDRARFSDLAAPTGDRGLPGAERGYLLRPSGLAPDGLWGRTRKLHA